MRIPQHIILVALLAIQLVFLTAPANAAQTEQCQVAAKDAGLRLEQLKNTGKLLTDFISGIAIPDTPLTALFVVDISNEPAIQTRIKELAGLQSKGQVSRNLPDAIMVCTQSSPELSTLIEEVKIQQLLVDKLRLDFLALPLEQRTSLINSYLDLQARTNSEMQLSKERSAADKLQNEAGISIATAEEQAKSAVSSELREIAAQRALLEKTRESLGRLQAEMVSGLQLRAKFYQQTSEKLTALSAATIRQNASKPLPDAYRETVAIWRDLVDRVFERIAAPENYDPIPKLPKAPSDLLTRLKDSKEAVQYQSAYHGTETLKALLESERLQRFETERDSLYRLLLEAGRLRSVLLKENLRAGHEEILNITTDYFADIGRELRIVPYQVLAIFYSKVLDFRHKLGAGVSGWIDIAKQIFILLLFIGVLYATFAGLRRVSSALDRLRSYLVREKYSQAYARFFALWIQRGNAYVPWVIMLLGVHIAQNLVDDSDIAQVSLILPYVTYYFWYRIFLNFSRSVMGVASYSSIVEISHDEQLRLQRTSKQIGVFFFVTLAILHATQDAVGEALIYRIVHDFVLYAGILLLAYTAREWQKKIMGVAQHLLPDRIFNGIHTLCQNRLWSWFVSLPVLILLIAIKLAQHVQRWASEFDFFKKISAALFLRRIEHANKAKGGASAQQVEQLPQDYLQWFKLFSLEDKSLLINPSNTIISDIESSLRAWVDTSSLDHSLALFGEKGSGKSSLLDLVERRFKDCEVRRIKIPPKLTSREAVLSFFGKELGVDLQQGSEALLQADANMRDTVLLIDNAQNLFLGKLGGFEGYRAFAELMNSGTEHLFWCVAFNKSSWYYLCAVFGGLPLFRRAIEIRALSDTDILNLIKSRHSHTHYHLAYDDIIRATQSEGEFIGEHQVEKQFFRLLWGQANGNPRVALMLWVSSLSQLPDDRLKVGLPKHPKIRISPSRGEEALFVYTAIMRHENLTEDEVIAVTNLPENIVNSALGLGCANNLLECAQDGRYRIAPIAQSSLTQLLLGKNFIYE